MKKWKKFWSAEIDCALDYRDDYYEMTKRDKKKCCKKLAAMLMNEDYLWEVIDTEIDNLFDKFLESRKER